MYQKILIALQGRVSDQAVVNHVKALAVGMGARITLLRVIPVADDGGGGLGRQFQLEVGSSGWRRRNEAEEQLAEIERQLQCAGVPVETALVIGSRSEGDEIIGFASEQGHDLIAMASDSRSWLRHWICGSPAGEVQRKATVPALFVGDGARKEAVSNAVPGAPAMMAVLGSAEL